MANENDKGRGRPGAAKRRPKDVFPIVGIGASAGGLQALEKLFTAMPANSGMAFVVIQHLDPTRQSHMVELLDRRTRMDVVAVREGARVAPNCVYMILPNREVTIRDGVLHLAEPSEKRAARRPIDAFFTSLAEDQQERAIGIILSGTGSNGTAGIRAIKGEGGLTIAQAPESAQHAGMPRSAIASGMIDLTLPPEEMPDALLRYVRHFYVRTGGEAPEQEQDLAPQINRILALIRTRAGHDFGCYKRSTLMRRIHRRMGLASIERLADYESLLRRDQREVGALVKDLMINVTGFFRDPNAWDALGEAVIAPLIEGLDTGDSIRVWVPACATGEEAYSIALLLAEGAEADRKSLDVKIFATDTAEENLLSARRGVFPGTIERDVSDERLHRFFDQVDESYQIRKDLRDWVVFAPQNVLRDPPFFRVDLVSCRNFLIYLEEEAQRKVLALLHFALREGGHLFLGNAETVGPNRELFETVSKKWRIYRRVGGTRHDLVEFPVTKAVGGDRQASLRQMSEALPQTRVAEAAPRMLAEQFAPPSVVVDRGQRIVYFHGQTERYLAQPSGEPTRDLITVAREGLRTKLRSALQKAFADHETVKVQARIRPNRGAPSVNVTVTPLRTARAEGLMLVTFEEEAPASPSRAAEAGAPSAEEGGMEREFETELSSVREELSRTIAELEGSNEELKASNEEITAMNEELQSANEELETSKEELQSLNEELNTVNNQLQRKVEELENATNDLGNLLSSTDIATVFVDTRFRIRWFSPAINKLVDIIRSDIGRPFANFTTKFDDPKLLSDAETVLARLTPSEAEVQSEDGRWYLRRILPYRTRDDRIDGVVITFADITEIKRAEQAVRMARDQITQIYDAVPHPLVVLDPDLRVRSANQSFYQAFQVQRGETEERKIYELGNRQWDVERLRTLLSEVISMERPFQDFAVEHTFEHLGSRTMLLHARQVDDQDLVLLSIQDVTERKEWEQHQKLLVAELNHRVKNTLATVQSIAAQTARRSNSPEVFYGHFSERIQALARTHSLLSSANWESADLHDLITEALAAHRSGSGRIRLEGERIRLKPSAALALGLVVYELTTNAAKHGALSSSSGRLNVTWGLTGAGKQQALRLLWQERGGPGAAAPAQHGFGLTLIERSVGHELDGAVRFDFAPEGLSCEIDLPYGSGKLNP